MTTDPESLADYIEAARLMGEVTGEDLLDDLDQHDLRIGKIGVPSVTGWHFRLKDRDARDLIESRVWRAVRGWAVSAGTDISWCADKDTIDPFVSLRVWTTMIRSGQPYAGWSDLPSAVAAIHKHWKEKQ